MSKFPLAIILGALAVMLAATMASAGVVTLSEREKGDSVELVQIDDVTNQISIYEDGVLIETRDATARELAALARIKKGEDEAQKLEDLKAGIADLRGRPIVNVSDRLDRLEAIVIDLAEQIGAD